MIFALVAVALLGAVLLVNSNANAQYDPLGGASVVPPVGYGGSVGTAFDKGLRYMEEGKFEKAAWEFTYVTTASQKHLRGWVGLGDAWRMAGNPRKSEFAYKQALLIRGEDVQANFGYGLLLVQLGRTEEAEKRLIVLRELAPQAVATKRLEAALRGEPMLDEASGVATNPGPLDQLAQPVTEAE